MSHHMKDHTGKCSYFCDNYREKHIFLFLQDDSGSASGLFICEICQKSFSNKGNLERHKVHHLGNYKFFCGICRKGFSMKYRHEEHMMVVHEGRRFYCDYCGKGFNSKDALSSHKRRDH